MFQIDGLPNFLRYEAPLARLRRAGAPLQNSIWDSMMAEALILKQKLTVSYLPTKTTNQAWWISILQYFNGWKLHSNWTLHSLLLTIAVIIAALVSLFGYKF